MKIANIGFLLTTEVLQAVSYPSQWKEVQASSSAHVNQQIPTKTIRAVCSFTQEKSSLGHFTVYLGVRTCYLHLRAYINREAQQKACSSSSGKPSKDSAQAKYIYSLLTLGKTPVLVQASTGKQQEEQLKRKMKNNFMELPQRREVSKLRGMCIPLTYLHMKIATKGIHIALFKNHFTQY